MNNYIDNSSNFELQKKIRIFHPPSFNYLQILVNVNVVYTDCIEEHFDAIRITDKGAFIGKIVEGKFADYGFIPNHSIKEIYNGKKKKKTF